MNSQMVIGKVDELILSMRATMHYFAKGTPLRLSGIDDAIAELLGYPDLTALIKAVDSESGTLLISPNQHDLPEMWEGLIYRGTGNDSDQTIVGILFKHLMTLVRSARKDHEIEFGRADLDSLIMDEKSRRILRTIASERRHVFATGLVTPNNLLAVEAMIMAGSRADRYVVSESIPIVALPSSFTIFTPDVRPAKPLDFKALRSNDYLIDRNIKINGVSHFDLSDMVERSFMWANTLVIDNPYEALRILKAKQSVVYSKNNGKPYGMDTFLIFSQGEGGALILGAWNIDDEWNLSEIE